MAKIRDYEQAMVDAVIWAQVLEITPSVLAMWTMLNRDLLFTYLTIQAAMPRQW